MYIPCRLYAGLSALSFGGLTLGAFGQVSVRPLVVPGQQVPGAQPGVLFESAFTPLFDGARRIAFGATWTGPGYDDTNRAGLWMAETVGLVPVARLGDAAPGLPAGITWGQSFEAFNLRDGKLTLISRLVGPAVDETNDQAIWVGPAGGLSLVARLGAPAPQVDPPRTFTSLGLPVLNRSGQLAFSALVNAPGEPDQNGIWAGTPGNLQLVARTGDPAPGLADDIAIGRVNPPVLNNHGQVAFASSLHLQGTDELHDAGLFFGSAADPVPLVHPGTPAFGLDPALTFRSVGSPSINDAGQIAFPGRLTGPGVDDTNNDGLWAGTPGAILPVIREGDPAPRLADGTTFGFSFKAIINHSGRLAFGAFLSDPQGELTLSIWTGTAGNLELVARGGEPAPGTEPGVVFRPRTMGDIAFNNAGQLAFWAQLEGPGVDQTNNDGLWATDPTGRLLLVAREGDEVELAPGIVRTIQLVAAVYPLSAGTEDGGLLSFDDAGRLAYTVQFTDGTYGAFVATIPEPAAGLLLLMAGCLLGRRAARAGNLTGLAKADLGVQLPRPRK
jgi:hypothetical protein